LLQLPKVQTKTASASKSYSIPSQTQGEEHMKTAIELIEANGLNLHGDIEHFAELVRADERARVTNMLLYLHNKAAPYHNYYKHAAVELNRKAGEGEKI
jgi:hypothetical protein